MANKKEVVTADYGNTRTLVEALYEHVLYERWNIYKLKYAIRAKRNVLRFH